MRGKRFKPSPAQTKTRNIPAYAGKTLRCGLTRLRPARNIPAYAGKTRRVASVTILVSEHPRVCGENPDSTLSTALPNGTSPRMRGKRPSFTFYNFDVRNIPAYAGKTSCTPHPQDEPREHPRVCGENLPCASKALTPISEHPRVCGENRRFDCDSELTIGTSPRMRGKRPNVCYTIDVVRNIPAYAGKTHLTSG